MGNACATAKGTEVKKAAQPKDAAAPAKEAPVEKPSAAPAPKKEQTKPQPKKQEAGSAHSDVGQFLSRRHFFVHATLIVLLTSHLLGGRGSVIEFLCLLLPLTRLFLLSISPFACRRGAGAPASP